MTDSCSCGIREIQGKSRSLVGNGLYTEGTVVGGDDAFDHGQAEAGAGFLSSVVAVEDFGEVIFFDSDAGVGYFQGQVVIFLVVGFLDQAVDHETAAFGHGVNGINEQVQQGLENLVLVDYRIYDKVYYFFYKDEAISFMIHQHEIIPDWLGITGGVVLCALIAYNYINNTHHC